MESSFICKRDFPCVSKIQDGKKSVCFITLKEEPHDDTQ